MNSSNFHIQKENQVKKISAIVALVAMNFFSTEVKSEVAENAKKAVDAIVEIRKEVYKKMEDFDYEFNYEQLQAQFESSGATVNNNRNALASEIQTIIDSLIIEMSAEPSRIDDHINFKPVMKSDEIHANEDIIVKALKNISVAINKVDEEQSPADAPLNPEETMPAAIAPEEIKIEEEITLTEKDIQENPELAEEGLKAGDKISVEEITDIETKEALEETPTPEIPKVDEDKKKESRKSKKH